MIWYFFEGAIILFSGVAAFSITAITVAVAWIAVRPVVGGLVLGVVAAVMIMDLIVRSRRRRQQQGGYGNGPSGYQAF